MLSGMDWRFGFCCLYYLVKKRNETIAKVQGKRNKQLTVMTLVILHLSPVHALLG